MKQMCAGMAGLMLVIVLGAWAVLPAGMPLQWGAYFLGDSTRHFLMFMGLWVGVGYLMLYALATLQDKIRA